MTVRVTLITPATSEALRGVRFDDDSSLDPEALARTEALAGTVGRDLPAFTSPSLRCRRTAEALGLAAEPLAAIAPCDMGRWRGRTLDSVAASEEEAVMTWLTDPAASPHGGEPLRQFRERVGAWLDSLDDRSGRLVAVAEPDIVRASLVHVLSAPDQAFWRFDVRPLHATELSGRRRRWNLSVGRPLTHEGPG
ncbi:histidine phosphatase family protein [Streptomyces sp. bgisy100]|uniref:histidine phosphatase family protein n=1 Tax=Streptomyces sp. bgisy100 TaxID=3413783 RepID=UPI003D727748